MIEYFKLKMRELRARVYILETISEIFINVKDDENYKLFVKIVQKLKETPESEWIKEIVENISSEKEK